MNENASISPEIVKVSLSEGEVRAAQIGAKDYAKALNKATLSQFFLLMKPEISEGVQDIFIGDKPVFYDETVRNIGGLFPEDRFAVAGDVLYSPSLVKKIIDSYPDLYKDVLPNLGKSSNDDLNEFFLKMTSPDFSKRGPDLFRYHTQMGLLLGIPKEDVEPVAKFISYRDQISKKIRLSVEDGSMEISTAKLIYKYLNKKDIKTEQMKKIEPILLDTLPLEFIDFPKRMKEVKFGAYRYFSVTNSGEEGKKHFEALREVSGIKQYLSSENLLRVLVNKFKEKAST